MIPWDAMWFKFLYVFGPGIGGSQRGHGVFDTMRLMLKAS